MKTLHWILALVVLLPVVPEVASARDKDGVKLSQNSKGKKRRTRRRAVRRPPPPPPRPEWALGLEVGWEAPYGNGASLHWMPLEMLDLHTGLGYNMSGVKFGIGTNLLLDISRDFGFRGGLVVAGATGTTGDVTLDATFTPENGGETETIAVTKTYEVTSSVHVNLNAGMYLTWDADTRLVGDLTYNMPVSGNEVTVGDEMSYEEDIEVTNSPSFERRFDEKAKEEAAAGGLGFMVGLQFFL